MEILAPIKHYFKVGKRFEISKVNCSSELRWNDFST